MVLKSGSTSPDLYIKGAEAGLGPDWFIYHRARSGLALWCVFMLKYGENDMPGKEFSNTKFDADYAALLHYADALATNETRSMVDMCSWLYRGSKILLSTTAIDAALPREENIHTAAYFRWEQRGRLNGHELDDWVSVERNLIARCWDDFRKRE